MKQASLLLLVGLMFIAGCGQKPPEKSQHKAVAKPRYSAMGRDNKKAAKKIEKEAKKKRSHANRKRGSTKVSVKDVASYATGEMQLKIRRKQRNRIKDISAKHNKILEENLK